MEHPDTTRAVFYIRNRTLILVLSPLVFILATSRIIANIRYGDPWLNWLAALVMWVFLFLLALRKRLVLTHDGLEYGEFFTTSSYMWSQLTGITSRKTLGIWTIEGLTVRTESLTTPENFIDLNQFSKRWRQEAIGAILRERAPHLFPRITG